MENLAPYGRLSPVGGGLESALRTKGGQLFQEQCLVAEELLRAGFTTVSSATLFMQVLK